MAVGTGHERSRGGVSCSKFEFGRYYAENEVNAIISRCHGGYPDGRAAYIVTLFIKSDARRRESEQPL